LWVQLSLYLLPIQWGSSHFIQLDKRCKQNAAGLQNKMHKKIPQWYFINWFFEKFIYPYEIQNKHCLFSIWISLKITQSKSVFKIFFPSKFPLLVNCSWNMSKYTFRLQTSNKIFQHVIFLCPLTVCFLKDMRQWL